MLSQADKHHIFIYKKCKRPAKRVLTLLILPTISNLLNRGKYT